jgi:hypothetical protein
MIFFSRPPAGPPSCPPGCCFHNSLSSVNRLVAGSNPARGAIRILCR